MEKISAVGKTLKEKSKKKQIQLEAKYQETWTALEEHLQKSLENKLLEMQKNIEKNHKSEIAKELRLMRGSIIKTRKNLLRYFLPITLISGLLIGILGTVYYDRDKIMIDKKRIEMATSADGKPIMWYKLTVDEIKVD